MLKVNVEEQEKLATSYSKKVSNNIDEQSMAYSAYLAGMHKQYLTDNEAVHKIIDEVVRICLYDLSANFNRPEHVEYAKYLLNGGTLTEEEWFSTQCK